MANFNEQGNQPDDVMVDVECIECHTTHQVKCSHYWDIDEEQWNLLGPSWKFRCNKCQDGYLDRLYDARQLQSQCAPSWFNPADAGERWSED